jgi:hypothetical protein
MTTTDTTTINTQTTSDADTLPELSYLGGTKAMTLTPHHWHPQAAISRGVHSGGRTA